MRLASLLIVPAALCLLSGSTPEPATPPVPLPATPMPRSCQVDPVSLEYLSNLLATPAPATPAAADFQQGVPAIADDILPVHRVIFEVFACLNAGEPARAYGLYSDDYLRRILNHQDPASLELLLTPSPLERDEWTILVEIRAIRTLADGRVIATVVLDPALIPVQKTFGFVLIAIDGRWVVDEVLDEIEFSLP